jgi:hypothetical protein
MYLSFLATLAALIVFAGQGFSGELERRTFTVLVDGKPQGNSVMEIQSKDDGTVAVTVASKVEVKIVIKYTFNFQGTEVWKEDKLLQMITSTNDNGKKLTVSLERKQDGFTINATGKDSAVKGELWPTTYWKLPPEGMRTDVNLIDSDTGKIIPVKMEKVGTEKLTVAGQTVNSNHYHLSGGLKADLWYDGNNRLLRQEMVEQGHRTVLELSRLQRE